jgi:hypothetical protein
MEVFHMPKLLKTEVIKSTQVRWWLVVSEGRAELTVYLQVFNIYRKFTIEYTVFITDRKCRVEGAELPMAVCRTSSAIK